MCLDTIISSEFYGVNIFGVSGCDCKQPLTFCYTPKTLPSSPRFFWLRILHFSEFLLNSFWYFQNFKLKEKNADHDLYHFYAMIVESSLWFHVTHSLTTISNIDWLHESSSVFTHALHLVWLFMLICTSDDNDDHPMVNR